MTKRIVYGILTLSLCFVIFGFSNATGDESGGLSLKLTQWFLNTFWPFNYSLDFLDICHLLVRKLAHMSEYALLYFFSYQFTSTYRFNEKQYYLYPFVFTSLNALADEFHQLFVDGRAGSLMDVGIDCCGIIVMMVIIYAFKKCKAHKSMI